MEINLSFNEFQQKASISQLMEIFQKLEEKQSFLNFPFETMRIDITLSFNYYNYIKKGKKVISSNISLLVDLHHRINNNSWHMDWIRLDNITLTSSQVEYFRKLGFTFEK